MRNWVDPRKALWGFHCHQELPPEQFPDALLVQKHCAEYLQRHGMEITSDAFEPGYGPHADWMWELRIERGDPDALEQMGIAAAFLAVNRFHMNAFIHPLMHDPNKDEDLETEGRMNQVNILWFGNRVPQNQDFFFNPPRTDDNQIADTRNPNMLNEARKQDFISRASRLNFRKPEELISNGFSISVDFTEGQKELALEVLTNLEKYLHHNSYTPIETTQYAAGKKAPHVAAGWEIDLSGKDAFRAAGVAIGWLMCNRQGLSVYVLPRTWVTGDISGEENAYKNHSSFIETPPLLKLSSLRSATQASAYTK